MFDYLFKNSWPKNPNKIIEDPPNEYFYKIFQDGFGKFKICEYTTTEPNWIILSHSGSDTKDCKSIDDCHEYMKKVNTWREQSKYKQVWP
jgi:hypothetical protein